MTIKVPVKKHTYDPSLSWEENYRALEKHHLEEVTWLMTKLQATTAELEALVLRLPFHWMRKMLVKLRRA